MPLVTPTDADCLADIIWRHTEDATLSSGLWTLAEVATYLTERQNALNAAAGLVLARTTVAVAADSKATLPADWSATHRVSWHPAFAPLIGRTFHVERGDRFAAYASLPERPSIYDDHSGGTRVLELFPPPTASDGTLDLLYISTLMAFALNPAAPVTCSLPADFVPYIVYGACADMLSKAGRGQDLERAKYCELRYAEGTALANLLLEGFA
jgi:hypothetical protein